MGNTFWALAEFHITTLGLSKLRRGTNFLKAEDEKVDEVFFTFSGWKFADQSSPGDQEQLNAGRELQFAELK